MTLTAMPLDAEMLARSISRRSTKATALAQVLARDKGLTPSRDVAAYLMATRLTSAINEQAIAERSLRDGLTDTGAASATYATASALLGQMVSLAQVASAPGATTAQQADAQVQYARLAARLDAAAMSTTGVTGVSLTDGSTSGLTYATGGAAGDGIGVSYAAVTTSALGLGGVSMVGASTVTVETLRQAAGVAQAAASATASAADLLGLALDGVVAQRDVATAAQERLRADATTSLMTDLATEQAAISRATSLMAQVLTHHASMMKTLLG